MLKLTPANIYETNYIFVWCAARSFLIFYRSGFVLCKVFVFFWFIIISLFSVVKIYSSIHVLFAHFSSSSNRTSTDQLSVSFILFYLFVATICFLYCTLHDHTLQWLKQVCERLSLENWRGRRILWQRDDIFKLVCSRRGFGTEVTDPDEFRRFLHGVDSKLCPGSDLIVARENVVHKNCVSFPDLSELHYTPMIKVPKTFETCPTRVYLYGILRLWRPLTKTTQTPQRREDPCNTELKKRARMGIK